MKVVKSARAAVTLFTLTLALLLSRSALAHHGWAWASGEEYELTGEIFEVKLGNPHGLVKIVADGDIWTVEVGQPWRNQRAGLTDDMLAVGRTVTFHGHRSSTLGDLVLKAERVVIDGQSYNLYPDRES